MSTAALRLDIKDASERLNGRRWINGLGFDLRGWEYTISEPDGLWCALKRTHNNGTNSKHGKGTTPEEARKNARPMDY